MPELPVRRCRRTLKTALPGYPPRRGERDHRPPRRRTSHHPGGRTLFSACGESGSRFTLFIEAPPDDEYCQAVDPPDDLVAVSMPEGGPIEQAHLMLELVRRYHIPLVVLPKGHPGSKRLSMVVSVAPPAILLACDIRRGTHPPEQHLLCSSAEFSGLSLAGGVPGGLAIGNLPPGG
ncbi:alpha/beta hydrolase [Methanoculleus chikugoensis]|uniref:alpha/beta hydrolase n=1 Tax=Methanoculleus chikugoensis TaxID=118126 RepID=UPI001FB27427|nr:alpha/beta hydrolase [Methanoculleus chikugoensis]